MTLCITGMHRSGTSLTAAWLEQCGLIIHDGNVYGPSIGNLKGHFEDAEFVELHASAARSQHPASDGWRVFGSDFLKLSPEEWKRAIALARSRQAKFTWWGWKDPRTVMFLPQWKELIPSLKVVLLWRPCSEVAASLVRRSRRRGRNRNYRISLLESVRLWKYYNECAYRYKTLYPDESLLFSVYDVIQKDRRVLQLISQRFGINLTFRPIGGLFDPGLMHTEVGLPIRAVATLCHARELEGRLGASSDV